MKEEIIELHKLLKSCTRIKQFVKYLMYNEMIDWEKSIKESPNNFNFTDIDYVKNNVDGSPIIFIGYIPEKYNKCYILVRENNPDNEFFENHIVFDESTINNKSEKISLTDCVGQLKYMNIIAIQLIGLTRLENKFRYHEDPTYEYELKNEERKFKCLELRLFNIMKESVKLIPSIADLSHEFIYKNYIEQSIKRYINNPKFKSLYFPIKSFEFKLRDFELDHKRKRVYIEGILSYTYINENDEEVTYRYGSILPLFKRFQKNIYSLNTYDVLLYSVYDSLLQIFNGFNRAIIKSNISNNINRITFNGFSNEILYKFRII